MEDQKLSIRFNSEDWNTHQRLKELLLLKGTYGEDTETIKISESIAFAVLHNLFGDKLSQIFNRARTKAIGERKLGRPRKPQIVMHPLDANV